MFFSTSKLFPTPPSGLNISERMSIWFPSLPLSRLIVVWFDELRKNDFFFFFFHSHSLVSISRCNQVPFNSRYANYSQFINVQCLHCASACKWWTIFVENDFQKERNFSAHWTVLNAEPEIFILQQIDEIARKIRCARHKHQFVIEMFFLVSPFTSLTGTVRRLFAWQQLRQQT